MSNSTNTKQDRSLELLASIRDSSTLEPEQAFVFDLNLKRLRRYQQDTGVQIAHSHALLGRMRRYVDVQRIRSLSDLQREMPHFADSASLQELFSRGLVLLAQKDVETEIHSDSLDKLFKLPYFQQNLEIQRAAAALLLESIANCKSPGKAKDLERRFWSLPLSSKDPQIQKMADLSRGLTEKTGRQPVVKIDLNQKVPSLVRAFHKLLGMGDYRMRVWLGGSARYKHLVVKVAARSEQSATQAVQTFMDDFLASDRETAREILEVFPPGSVWESGRYPVLKL